MSVDLSKIKTGDEVLLRATADVNGLGELAFRFRGELGQFDGSENYHYLDDEIPADAIVSHTPKAIGVGELVCKRLDNGELGNEGRVLAVEGESAWVLFWKTPQTVPLSELERV
jgi:hypothetical protein